MLLYICYMYVALKQIPLKVSRIVFARNERAARENMRDDKIYVSYQRVQSCTPSHLCGPRNWWLLGNGLHNEHRDSRGREGTRKKGKVDRDKADAIITIFFLHAPYSQLEITRDPVDDAPRRVTPLTQNGFRLRIVRYSHSVPRHSPSEIPPRFWTTDENYALDD